jgi:hypothetical protein
MIEQLDSKSKERVMVMIKDCAEDDVAGSWRECGRGVKGCSTSGDGDLEVRELDVDDLSMDIARELDAGECPSDEKR